MTFIHSFTPNISSPTNFHNLALFICHLFIDGHFRTSHILYDPNVLDNQLFTEIQVNCPHIIPWLITDVTQPFSIPWTPNQTNDHILQLIFLDPDHFPNDIDDLKDIFTLYRLFIFFTKNPNELKSKVTELKRFKVLQSDDSLIFLYDFLTGFIWLHQGSDTNQVTTQTCDSNDEFKEEKLFECIFGESGKNWMIMIRYAASFSCRQPCKQYKVQEMLNTCPFFAHFYLWILNASYINRTEYIYENPNTMIWENRIIRHKYPQFYKELTLNYEPMDNKSLDYSGNRRNILRLDLNAQFEHAEMEGNKTISPLHSQRSLELSVLFVYGQNYQRQYINNSLSKLKLFLFNWTNVFVILAAVVLCILRRMTKIQRDGFIAVLIDVMVIFTGGGRLRMDHKCERWFFVIMSIGALFLNAICLETTLFPAYLLRQKNVDTFQHLAEINPPIYLAPMLARDEHLIAEMLKNRMGETFNFMGSGSMLKLALMPNSTAYIFPTTIIEQVRMNRRKFIDSDILQEKLGSLPLTYYLESNRLLPERMKVKIEKATVSLMESGIHRFYESLNQFLERFRAEQLGHTEEDDFHALTSEELRCPIIFCSYLLGFACVVFLLEWITYYMKRQRVIDVDSHEASQLDY